MSLVLTNPVTSPTRTMTLRNPNQGDEEEVKTHQIIRRTRGGETKGFRDPDWLKVHTFKYDISALSRETKDLLIEFLVATTGKRIKFVDHNSSEREGYVITPVVEIVTLRDNIPPDADMASDCADGYGFYDATFEIMQDPNNAAYNAGGGDDDEYTQDVPSYYILKSNGNNRLTTQADANLTIQREDT